MRLVSMKRMEFSGKVCITGHFPGEGVIKAVLDDGKWIFKGRRIVTPEFRSHLDSVMTKEWETLQSYIPSLAKCPYCKTTMHEDICLECNRE